MIEHSIQLRIVNIVNAVVDQLPPLGKKELVFLLLFTCGFCFGEVSLPLCTWDGLHFFIVALPGPSVDYIEKIV